MEPNCEWSITCGVKKELRDKYTDEELMSRLFNILSECGGKEIVVCVEKYQETGYHVHAYYYGKNIFWKDFNKKWEIGYVKNRNIYNKDGWINYIKKQEKYFEYGQPKKQPIERFTGYSLEKEADNFRMLQIIEALDECEGFTPVSSSEDDFSF